MHFLELIHLILLSFYLYESNIGANLRSSVNASGSDSTGTHEMQLTTKSGVAAALVELKRLPILSVVEEKLYIRDELIDWNNNAIGVMEASTCSKIPYKQIEDLHNELMNIIDLKSQGRVIVKNLRPSKAVDSELHLFALDDEKVICIATGSWVRDQYKRASEWKKRYDSLIEGRCLIGSGKVSAYVNQEILSHDHTPLL